MQRSSRKFTATMLRKAAKVSDPVVVRIGEKYWKRIFSRVQINVIQKHATLARAHCPHNDMHQRGARTILHTCTRGHISRFSHRTPHFLRLSVRWSTGSARMPKLPRSGRLWAPRGAPPAASPTRLNMRQSTPTDRTPAHRCPRPPRAAPRGSSSSRTMRKMLVHLNPHSQAHSMQGYMSVGGIEAQKQHGA